VCCRGRYGDSAFLQLPLKEKRDGDAPHMEKKLRARCLVCSYDVTSCQFPKHDTGPKHVMMELLL